MAHWLAVHVWPTALHTAVTGLTAALIVAPFRSALKKLWRVVKTLDPLDPYPHDRA